MWEPIRGDMLGPETNKFVVVSTGMRVVQHLDLEDALNTAKASHPRLYRSMPSLLKLGKTEMETNVSCEKMGEGKLSLMEHLKMQRTRPLADESDAASNAANHSMSEDGSPSDRDLEHKLEEMSVDFDEMDTIVFYPTIPEDSPLRLSHATDTPDNDQHEAAKSGDMGDGEGEELNFEEDSISIDHYSGGEILPSLRAQNEGGLAGLGDWSLDR